MIQAAADQTLEKLRTGVRSNAIAYPPGATISSHQVEALAACSLGEDALAALRALVTDACASTVFQLLALLDGVADPEVRPSEQWLGADIVAIDDEEDREMLHDAFMDAWWAFQEDDPRT